MKTQDHLTNPLLPAVTGNFTTGQSATALSKFASTFIVLAFGLAGLVLFIMLIWGGYRYMTAGGDKEATQAAMKRITNAIVGIAILFSVYAILGIIGYIFGISLLSLPVPTLNS